MLRALGLAAASMGCKRGRLLQGFAVLVWLSELCVVALKDWCCFRSLPVFEFKPRPMRALSEPNVSFYHKRRIIWVRVR